MNLDALSKLVTVCLFGGAGWLIAQRLRLPVAIYTWMILLLMALGGSFVKFWLVALFGFTIYANWAIVACCAGVLVGLVARSVITHQGPNRTPAA